MAPVSAGPAVPPDQLVLQPDDRQNDPWLGTDKFLHFGVSLALTCGMFYGCRQVALVDEDTSLILAPTWTLVTGLAKEDFDLKEKETFVSAKDLVADGLGIAAGMLIIFLAK